MEPVIGMVSVAMGGDMFELDCVSWFLGLKAEEGRA